MPSPPKDLAELDGLLNAALLEWEVAEANEMLTTTFGPYLRRRLAEHGVTLVPRQPPKEISRWARAYGDYIKASPYYTTDPSD